LVAYTVLTVRQGRKQGKDAAEFTREYGARDRGWPRVLRDVVFVLGGLAALVVGAGWFVDAAVTLARALGVSELVIGLTIVAVGTSLPELAASVIASIKGERDIAVGNVVGSNLFNILCVLGLSAAVAPAGVAVAPTALSFDIPVMTAVAVACLPIFFAGHRLDRWEGGVFLVYYAAYTAYLVLAADESGAAADFAQVMRLFVLPLTGLTLAITTTRAWRARRRSERLQSTGHSPPMRR
jgi:cation:H+ antiporter